MKKKKKKDRQKGICGIPPEKVTEKRLLRRCGNALLITASYQLFSLCVNPGGQLPPEGPAGGKSFLSNAPAHISSFFTDPAYAVEGKCVLYHDYCNCTGCTGCTGCTDCTRCTGCTGCTGGCTACTGCTSCTGCTGCTGATSYFNKGIELLNSQSPNEAEAYFRKAIEMNPTAEAYTGLGVALDRQGRYAEAKEAYRQALRLNPQYELARKNLQILEEQERRAEYRSVFQRGLDLLNRNDYKGAEMAFRRAIELNPKDAGTYNNLSIALLKQDRNIEAASARRTAYTLDPTPERKKSLVSMLDFVAHNLSVIKKQYREGEQYYIEALSLDPNNAELKRDYRNNLINQYNEAVASKTVTAQLEAARKLVRLHPENAENHVLVGGALFKSGDIKGGKDAYREAIRLNPKDYTIQTGLGGWLREGKDYQGALSAYRASLSLIPEDMVAEKAATHTLMGMTLDLMGDRENAQKELVEGARLAPDESVVCDLLGKFLFNHGQYREAEEILRRVVVIDPKNEEARKMLSETHRQIYGLGTPETVQKRVKSLNTAFEIAAKSYSGKGLCNWFVGKIAETKEVDIPYFRGILSDKSEDGRMANELYRFVEKAVQSKASGWRQVTPDEAQQLANAGRFVIAVARNLDPAKSGHIAIVAPESLPHVKDVTRFPLVRDSKYPLESVRAGMSFGVLSSKAKTNPQIADTVEPLWVVWEGDLLKEVGYPRIQK